MDVPERYQLPQELPVPTEHIAHWPDWLRASALVVGLGVSVVACGGGESPSAARQRTPETTQAQAPITEAPTTTTEVPIINPPELQPNQYLGTMSLQISGSGALRSVVTEPLSTDARTRQQAIVEHLGINPDDVNLMKGFVLHVETPPPAYLPFGYKQNQNHWIPVIAAHRATPVDGSPHGPLYDADKIMKGDTLTFNMANGTTAVYETIATGFAPEGSNELDSVLFQQTTEDKLVLYACADASGGNGGGQQYNPINRTYAVFARVK